MKQIHSRMAGFALSACLFSHGASALIDSASIYQTKLGVPAFVKDVRKLVVESGARHSWKVIDEKSGEVTLELRHLKMHAHVVAKVFYTPTDIRLEMVNADSFDCVSKQPCGADPGTLQRWMLTLRREMGVNLLYMAIQDAGGPDLRPERRTSAAQSATDAEEP